MLGRLHAGSGLVEAPLPPGRCLMSALTAPPQPQLSANGPPSALAFHYTQTESFPALLHQLQASLLVSTYQANKLLVVRAAGNGLSTLVRTFERPMGMALDARRMALGRRR